MIKDYPETESFMIMEDSIMEESEDVMIKKSSLQPIIRKAFPETWIWEKLVNSNRFVSEIILNCYINT